MRKNILRLPGVFFSLFLSFSVSTLLILLCGSVRDSCEKARHSIDVQFEVTLTITEKKQMEFELNRKGVYSQNSSENHLINTVIYNAVRSDDRIGQVDIITNKFYFSLGIMCPQETFDAIQSAAADGNPFDGVIESYYSGKRMRYDIGVVGCSSPSLAAQALGTGSEPLHISYSDRLSYDDGLILPQWLYELYDEPDMLVIGWYVTRAGGQIVPEDNTYRVKGDFEDYYMELLQKPDAPKLHCRIAGYYSCDNYDSGVILCPESLWEQIYCAQDYYNYTDNVQNYYRQGINAMDECGIARITAELKTPGAAPDVIRNLTENQVNPDNYAIEANDFDYKFAVSQMKGIETFADAIWFFALAFCSLLTAVSVSFSVKKRRAEIRIYRTLGEAKATIVLRIALETTTVLFAALAIGYGTAMLFGSAICGYLNRVLQTSAMSTVDKLSQISSFLKNSDLLKKQIESAIKRYLNCGFILQYHVRVLDCFILIALWLCISLFSLLCAVRNVSHNLMERD